MKKLTLSASLTRAVVSQQRRASFEERRSRAEDEAAPPTVVGALAPDNLLPKELVYEGAVVEVQKWDRVLAGDVITLYFDDQSFSEYRVEDPAQEEFPMRFLLSSNLLGNDGTYVLRYEVVADSGADVKSRPTNVRIDMREPGGGAKPLPIVFDEEVRQHGITPEYLESNGDQVVGVVPKYALMEVGQAITYSWAHVTIGTATVTQEDVEQGLGIAVSFPGSLVREFGEGFWPTHYVIRSRAGIDSKPSDMSNVNVYLTKSPANLEKPVVPLAADDGLVDLSDVNFGVDVQVPRYDNATGNDIVELFWGDQFVAGAPVTGSFPIPFAMPRRIVIVVGSGDISVYYVIKRNKRSWKSPIATVSVDVSTVGPEDPNPETPENEALMLPTVVGGVSNKPNELTPEDRGTDATVRVPFYENAKADEVITVHWGKAPDTSTPLAPYTVTNEDIADATFPDIIVPASVVEATANNPAFRVYYTLKGGTNENEVLSPDQSVVVRLTGPGGPGGLKAPAFTEVNGRGWLLLEPVQDGTNIVIDPYVQMKVGDTITVKWQAYSTTNAAAGTEITGSDYWESVVVTEQHLAEGAEFVVPFEKISPIAEASTSKQGAGIANYIVTQDGYDYTSAPTLVKVDLGQP